MEEFKQTTSAILMIEPVAFGFNAQTAVNNYFQQSDNPDSLNIQNQALAEFYQMVKQLRSNELNIITVKDRHTPHTPDSIFPNNWVSFHEDGRVVLYPMYAENRREERRTDIIQILTDHGFRISNIVDYTFFEKQNRFLEGTGSMILDHINKIAYAALSDRTDKELFFHFCKEFDFKPVCFRANQTVRGKRLPIYHTNVMMCIGDQYAVICLSTIDNTEERDIVISSLTKSGKNIIEVSEVQMQQFACNMLQVENITGTHFLVMSLSASSSLTAKQTEQLTFYNEIIPVVIPTIEKYGGGSARCMMAEIFNPINT